MKWFDYKQVRFQIVYWTLGYIISCLLSFQVIIVAFGKPQSSLAFDLICAVLVGAFQGLFISLIANIFEIRYIKRLPWGIIILFSAICYFMTTILSLTFFQFGILGLARHLITATEYKIFLQKGTGRRIFYLMSFFNLILSFVLSLITQLSQKFGPGKMLALLFGKYRTPLEENRIFLFMDLRSSTTIAERLGHLRYSAFIRDCFFDINSLLGEYKGEIYQYVGDEVVITWSASDKNTITCVGFFYACHQQFCSRAPFYQKKYGFIPEFKAGAHLGSVTAVEVGEIKREIAYHGDTINTAARIQSLCNTYKQLLLVSGDFAHMVFNPAYQFQVIGDIQLKGKSMLTEIMSVSLANVNQIICPDSIHPEKF